MFAMFFMAIRIVLKLFTFAVKAAVCLAGLIFAGMRLMVEGVRCAACRRSAKSRA